MDYIGFKFTEVCSIYHEAMYQPAQIKAIDQVIGYYVTRNTCFSMSYTLVLRCYKSLSSLLELAVVFFTADRMSYTLVLRSKPNKLWSLSEYYPTKD